MIDTKELLARVRKRANASLLNYVESQSWWARLTPAQKAELRERVFSSSAAYHDAVLDVVATLDGGGGVYNEHALELLQQIHLKVGAGT